MGMNRREFVGAALGTALLPGALPAQTARSYPTKLVTVYHPNPGGVLDLLTRLIAAKMSATWGQPVIVDTKPGTGGSVAAAFLAKSPPDGHTLVIGGSAIVNNLLGSTPRGYTLEDLAPVYLVASFPTVFAVRASLGVNTMAEYLALARSRPGKLTFGSSGVGSGTHILGEIVNLEAKIDTVHVPYKAEAPALVDLLSGTIDTVYASLFGIAKYQGKIVPLAVASTSRVPAYPDIPTFTEAGLPAANKPGWAAMFAPAKTPGNVIETIGTELRRILALPDVLAKFNEFALVPGTVGPDKMGEFFHNYVIQMRALESTGRVKFG